MDYKKYATDIFLEEGRSGSLLKGEYQLTRIPVYRGSSYDIDQFQEREIRKDREPRDTSSITDNFINGVEDGYYPDVPKRSQSKFGTVFKKEAKRYGDYVYVVIPHKEANVVSLSRDSIDYFYGFRPGVEKLQKYIEDELPKLSKLLEIFQNRYSDKRGLFYEEDGSYGFYELAKNHWDEIKGEIERLRKVGIPFNKEVDGLKSDVSYKMLVRNIEKWKSGIEDYFGEMKEGVQSNADEVIFDGPKYLIVQQDFYRKVLRDMK